MAHERFERLQSVYEAAFRLEAEAREAYLNEACSGDSDLKREVESLLRENTDVSVLEKRALEMAADSLARGAADFLPGRQIGSYKILALLGAGGMGKVYRARDTKLNRSVAIKFLSHEPESAAARRRFQREAQMASSLNHPHILTVYDVDEFEGRQYLVTEFVDGGTLSDWAKAEKRTWQQTVELLTNVADGLATAHSAGIMHRDIKPANILVAKNGYAKLADFGLAKLTDPTSDGITIRTTFGEPTQVGMIVGTIAYMSPEQASGKAVDVRSDIFSFGVVLYELFAERRPFTGATDLERLQAVIHKAALPLGANVPAELQAVVEKALEKNPADRYQSMREMVIDLRRFMRYQKTEVTRAPKQVASIAVLPFTDLSAAKDQDWFCDGIAEEILNALTSLKDLRVAARTSAFSFKGKSDDLRTIGEKLNVTTVLEGSVRRVGDRVRITAQLNDVQNGYQLWSERYDRELKDIFDIQDEIAKSIANRLKVTLTGIKDNRVVAQATTNMEAYQLCLKGRALLDRRGASVPAGLDLLRRAVEFDPGYSLAWAGVADAFTVLAYSGAVGGSKTKTQALAAAARSIEIDPASAAAHTALACSTLVYENNRVKAQHEFEHALELNPSHVMGHCWYALLYLQWACGEFEQGIAEARRALEIDPLSAYAAMTVAACLCTAGRLDEAIEMARRAVRQDADSFVARWMLGVSLGTARRFEEAALTLEAAASMSGRHTLALTCLAGVFGQWKKPAESSILHRELMERAERGYVPAAHLALTAEAAGEHENAMVFARRAWDEREPPFILWARHFPQYRTLHSDSRFAVILREMDSSNPGF